MYLPEYTWEIIKKFLFRKKHPTAKLMRPLCLRYTRPQIFISNYYKLRNGMFVRLTKPFLQIEVALEKTISFSIWFKKKSKKVLKNQINPIR